MLNVAPVLNGANDLAAVTKNQPALSNSGTLVKDLVAGKITDPDGGALAGIAVTATDNTHGTWQFSTNAGLLWSPLNPADAQHAILLAADASTTLIRFNPAAGFSGSVSAGDDLSGLGSN